MNKRTGGESFHVRECHIWAAISYLDSPTDYREYISQHPRAIRPSLASEVVMLASHKRRQGLRGSLSKAIGWTVPAVLLVIAGMFVYLVSSS